MILVTGARDNVGRHLVGLFGVERLPSRAIGRHPEKLGPLPTPSTAIASAKRIGIHSAGITRALSK